MAGDGMKSNLIINTQLGMIDCTGLGRENLKQIFIDAGPKGKHLASTYSSSTKQGAEFGAKPNDPFVGC
ncbi:MAG: hypothetical protein KDJ35_02565 [Alphaproteobacteria bacterium]|nr:hypothetical protein [Alphaproteobacteria bacterium]